MIAAIVHVIAAVEFPVVVFDAAAVEAIRDATVDSDRAFVLIGLADDTGRQGHELRKIAAVQLQLVDLLTGDGSAEFRGTGLNLSDAFARYNHFLADGANRQLYVDTYFLRHIEHDLVGAVFLKALSGDVDVIGPAGQTSHNVGPIRVGNRRPRPTSRYVHYDDFNADNCRAGLIRYGTTDIAGVLGARGDSEGQHQQCGVQQRLIEVNGIPTNKEMIAKALHDSTSEVFESGKGMAL